MALIFVRHTTPLVAAGTCYGRTDLALGPHFETEADAVAEALVRFDASGPILTSPLMRCCRLAARLGPFETRPAFIEMDFGAWEGQPWAAIPRAELDAWAADFLDARPHGGETVADLRDRVSEGMAGLEAGTIIVTHAGVIKAAAALRGHPDGWDIKPDFGEVLLL